MSTTDIPEDKPTAQLLGLGLGDGLGVTRFAPSVVVDGRTVQPEGWMWVLSFALAGVPWAVETASTDEFRERCRAGLKAMRDREAESEIAHLERRIAALKAGLMPKVGIEPPYPVGSNDGLGVWLMNMESDE